MTASAPSIPSPEPVAPAPARQRFLLLDGLRGVAAFAVILDHVPSETLRSWLPGRYLAVDFFFVLSGFVLAHAYGQRLRDGWSPLAFMRARLIRLYPLYLAALAIGAGFAAISAMKGWGEMGLYDVAVFSALGLLFLPAPLFHWPPGGLLFPFNGPAWSLFFELIANFVYAFVARFLTWRVFAVVLPIGAAAVAVTVMRHHQVGGPGWMWWHFDAGLSRVLYDFFCGVAIYQLHASRRLPAMPAWAAVAAFLAIIAFPATGLWRPAFDAFAGIVLFPLLLMFACNAKVSGRLARLCGVLGLLSYGVYVLHVPILTVLQFVFSQLHVVLPYGFLNVATVALVATVVAVLADRFYDAPLRRWLTARLPSRAKRNKTHPAAGELG